MFQVSPINPLVGNSSSADRQESIASKHEWQTLGKQKLFVFLFTCPTCHLQREQPWARAARQGRDWHREEPGKAKLLKDRELIKSREIKAGKASGICEHLWTLICFSTMSLERLSGQHFPLLMLDPFSPHCTLLYFSANNGPLVTAESCSVSFPASVLVFA